MATRTKDFNVTRDPSVISKQLVYTDSNENGSLNIPADYFGSKEELDSKFVTFYYNLGNDEFPDSTYEEVERQFFQRQKGLRLKTFVAAESVFLYGVMHWNGSQITFSEVIHGELIEATIDQYSNKWVLTRRNVAFKSELNAEATARENADNTLVNKIDDVSETLGGNITTLSGAIATEKNRAEAQENVIRESIIEAVNNLGSSIEAVDTKVDTLETKVNGKLESVAHDSTLQGDGTADNPLKVVGGGIEEAPDDGKQYARKSKSWSEVQGGVSSWNDIEDKPIEFPPTGHNHSVDDITDFPAIPTKTSDLQNDSGFIDTATFTAIYNTTPFADIEQAIADGYCVKCDVSGYTYELVHVLSDKITFALTNNVNGSIAQETVWVTSDNEWDGEAVNLANASDVTTALNGKADKTYVDDMLGNVEALLAAL